MWTAGAVEPLDYVLCGDPSVPVRLHALNLVFRARLFSLFSLVLIRKDYLGDFF